MYMTFGNIHPQHRSKIDQLQLVICRNQDIVHFGADKVFAVLVEYLKELEINGIDILDGFRVKAAVLCVTGDNLGIT